MYFLSHWFQNVLESYQVYIDLFPGADTEDSTDNISTIFGISTRKKSLFIAAI